MLELIQQRQRDEFPATPTREGALYDMSLETPPTTPRRGMAEEQVAMEELARDPGLGDTIGALHSKITARPGMTRDILNNTLDAHPRRQSGGARHFLEPLREIDQGLEDGTLTAQALDAAGRLQYSTSISDLRGISGSLRSAARQIVAKDYETRGEPTPDDIDAIIDRRLRRRGKDPIPAARSPVRGCSRRK